MADEVGSIRSHIVLEDDGSLCIYRATGPDAIREHASRADLPVDEIVEIDELQVVRLPLLNTPNHPE